MLFSDLLKRYNGGKTEGAQKKLAQALGTGIYNVCHWNAGRSFPSQDMREKLAAELGVDQPQLMAALERTRAERGAGAQARAGEEQAAYRAVSQGGGMTPVIAAVSCTEFRICDIDTMLPDEFLPIPQPTGGDRYIAFRVHGEAFAPLARDGEYLLVGYTQFVEDGRLALIVCGSNYIIGHIRWLDDERSEITPLGGKARRLRTEEVSVTGKVLSVLRKPQ